MQTYLFYDIETTGLNKAFDQVLHFAAIRTDLELNELERHEVKIKLNPDVIPSPYALITHHIGIEESLQGSKEFDAIRQIHQWLNTPGTISLGYNTLGFDDEFLRFSFYRNLLPPYSHQYAQQCGRMDLYPIAVLYFLFKKSIIQWPTSGLKLENINLVNQFISGRSHHAMVDVEVTLELARRFFKEREMWEYVLGYFNKQTDQTRAQELPAVLQSSFGNHQEGLMILGRFGNEKSFQCPVLLLGTHKIYKNQTAWLQLDTLDFSLLTPSTLIENAWVQTKKWGEPGIVLPPKERFLTSLTTERQQLAEANKQWLKQHPDMFAQLIDYHLNFTYPPVANVDPDASLYLNGFWSPEEENICRQLHKVNPAEKAYIVQKISNPKLKSLALRLVARNFPEALPAQLLAQFNEYMDKVNSPLDTPGIIDFKGGSRMTPLAALKEISEIRQKPDLDSIQIQLLNDLEGYLKTQFGVYYQH